MAKLSPRMRDALEWMASGNPMRWTVIGPYFVGRRLNMHTARALVRHQLVRETYRSADGSVVTWGIAAQGQRALEDGIYLHRVSQEGRPASAGSGEGHGKNGRDERCEDGIGTSD